MGSQAHETAEMIVSELELPMTPAEFMIQSKKQFEVLFPDTEVMPGKRNFQIYTDYQIFFKNM